MNILIIGGSRFLGPRIISGLLKGGHRISVFNRGSNPVVFKNKTIFIRGDRNKGFNTKDRFDVVIDTCAYNGLQTEVSLKQLNFDYYIHIGTAASYKKTEIFPLREKGSPLGEWPLWGDYNKGKVECERVLSESGVKFASVRPVYILGTNNHIDRERFIYSKIKNKKSLVLPGNGEAVIQFVFVQDVAKSVVHLAESKIEGAFNCCSDDPITLKGVVEEMGNILGKEPVVQFNPDADGDKFKIDEFPFANENFFCTNEKLRKLGIEFTPLLAGLRDDYQTHYKNVI